MTARTGKADPDASVLHPVTFPLWVRGPWWESPKGSENSGHPVPLRGLTDSDYFEINLY